MNTPPEVLDTFLPEELECLYEEDDEFDEVFAHYRELYFRENSSIYFECTYANLP